MVRTTIRVRVQTHVLHSASSASLRDSVTIRVRGRFLRRSSFTSRFYPWAPKCGHRQAMYKMSRLSPRTRVGGVITRVITRVRVRVTLPDGPHLCQHLVKSSHERRILGCA